MTKDRSETLVTRRSRLLAPLVGAALMVIANSAGAHAQQSFKTPEEAAAALVTAARNADRSAVLAVLGRQGADIASSGDEVEDTAARQRFVTAYEARHAIAMDGDAKAVMIVGQDDFPFPIPLVRKDSGWQFDAAAGRDEIVYRRIGRNELDAVQAALAYVDAQNDYAEKDRNGQGAGVYARRFLSQTGKKDGLYWPAVQGEDASPLGELVVHATADGYRLGGTRAPFHGYYFKILTSQGPSAPGGAMNYVVKGKMIGGFGLVAYPASYRNSGVMTYVVNHDGVVYQKDLGRRTAELAERMTSYNPDGTWKKVETPAAGR